MDLKICGMRETKNIIDVASLRPQYLGFIFYPQSPRFVGKHFRMPYVDPSIKKVGVFVNATTESIVETVHQYSLDLIQLHGHESAEQCNELKAYNVLIIKAFSVADKLEVSHINRYHEAADFFLFDTKGKYFGGNAQRFDWSILQAYDQRTPFFLSGGLKPENVEEANALKEMNIVALDVNSGVEIRPALKDVEKVKQVIEQVKKLEIGFS
jgi:phosphoribosylanthranilate isomerase